VLSRQLWTGALTFPASAAAPRSLEARLRVVTAPGQTRLEWSAAEAPTVDVYRTIADPFPHAYEKVASGVAPGWTDTAGKGKTIYAYRISRAGEPLNLAGLPAFNQAFRPSGLVVSLEASDKVTLRWNRSTEPDVIGYHVFRATRGGRQKLTTTPVSDPTYVDTTAALADGIIRAYWVQAVNRAGISSGNSPAGYTAPDSPLSFKTSLSTDGRKATVSWKAVEGQTVAGVQVWMNDHHENTITYTQAQNDAWWASWKTVAATPITASSVEVTLPDPGKQYYFYARAVNVLGQPGFHTDISSPNDPRFMP
jgi:hypothetical protein